MSKKISVLCLFFSFLFVQSQDSQKKELQFSGDFRFRAEHDWDSKKGDGLYREDRSRLRYRFRLQAIYTYKDWAQIGARVRTGSINDQQGPHITLGGQGGEFSTIQAGFEKLYFHARYKGLSGWLGKNTFPFYKQNELFWNDNVFPEGVAVSYTIPLKTEVLNKIQVNMGHFIVTSQNETLDKDSYFQGLQLVTRLWDHSVIIYPSFFNFHKLPNIPDAAGSFTIDYNIAAIGIQMNLLKKKSLAVGLDLYKNVSTLDIPQIPADLRNDKGGIVFNIIYGQLKKPKNWMFGLYYAYLEKYAIVDYFAQNDWARWDYSSFDATGSRLSNMKGFEVRIGYAINEKLNLVFRGYYTEQIALEASVIETGSRARIDLNFKF